MCLLFWQVYISALKMWEKIIVTQCQREQLFKKEEWIRFGEWQKKIRFFSWGEQQEKQRTRFQLRRTLLKGLRNYFLEKSSLKHIGFLLSSMGSQWEIEQGINILKKSNFETMYSSWLSSSLLSKYAALQLQKFKPGS